MICKKCNTEHDGEHLTPLHMLADVYGMECLVEFQQYQVEQNLCQPCTKEKDQS